MLCPTVDTASVQYFAFRFSGVGSTSTSSGNGSPSTSRAGRPRLSSRLFRYPLLIASFARRDAEIHLVQVPSQEPPPRRRLHRHL